MKISENSPFSIPPKSPRKSKNPMSIKIDIPKPELLKPKITIFGVGGAGGNALNNMMRSNLEGVEFVAANTDAQALANSLAQNRIQLGVKTTRGLGAGSFPDRGKVAAEENIEEIEKFLEGCNMVFIAAGMGGGTGTGAAPVIAKLAREHDILTVGVVTKPFHFEGKYRMETAESGIEELKKYVDTLIVIPNQNLFRIANESTTFESAFKMADDVLHAGVRGVTDLITMPGLVNLDFADIRTIMTKMGKAMMGTGEATGENRAILACEAAVSNPLLDDISIKGAKGVLVNMTGGPDMTLFEADMAVNAIRKEVDPSANIIFGSAFNEDMKGRIRISVVATGIDSDEIRRDTQKTSEVNETNRFRVNFGSENGGPKSSYFDPVAIQKVEQKPAAVEEISELNFKPKKVAYSNQENLEYGNVAASKEQEKISNHFDSDNELDLDQESGFFSFDEAAKFEEKESMPQIKKVASAKPQKTNTKPKKETSSGFSLFSFMNPAKSKDGEAEKQRKHKIELEEEYGQSDSKLRNSGPKKQSKFFSSETEFASPKRGRLEKSNSLQDDFEEEYDEDEELEKSFQHSRQKISERYSEAKDRDLKTSKSAAPKEEFLTQEARKKHKQFFGGTILDEEREDSSNNDLEDDIVNIPAFFRKKR